MAQYTINYSCGHSATKQLYGPVRERERRIAYLEQKGLCPECRRAEQSKQESEATEGLGLVQLAGTDKQVKWAESIRAQAITKIKNQMASQKQNWGSDVYSKVLDALVAAVNHHTEAGWWVDNRGNPMRALNDIYVAECQKRGIG